MNQKPSTINRELAELMVADIACNGIVGKASNCETDYLGAGICFIKNMTTSVFVIKEVYIIILLFNLKFSS